MSSLIDSTYSTSSFSGLVSSKRRLVWPPNSSAYPKSIQMALAWPMCRYPLGSGGKRVCTRPLYLLVLRSSRKRSRMKLEGRDSGAGLAPVSGSAAGVVIILDLTAKKAGANLRIAPEMLPDFRELGFDQCTWSGAGCAPVDEPLRTWRM